MKFIDTKKIPNSLLHNIYQNLRDGKSERIYNLNYIPYPKMKMLVLDDRVKEFHSPPTMREIIVEVKKLVQRSGDNHHIILEGFNGSVEGGVK